MPFIPHTPEEEQAMLEAIGVPSRDALFDEIPAGLICDPMTGGTAAIPEAINEAELANLMHARAAQDDSLICFAGAGAYDHHIPAAVWEVATRGEFYSAYTPYQAEASQGILQLVYEYQTMMVGLTGLDVSNASLYDGATALAEAVLMAVRANRAVRSGRILMPRSVHPACRSVVESSVKYQGISLELVDYDPDTGVCSAQSLPSEPGDIVALVIPQPNFFGCLEAVDELTDWAHAHGALVIAQVNPLALALLKPPGEWGGKGADIACGDGQPLGIPLSSGGPYFGFICCRQALVRQLPGRIVGRTVDIEGRQGFTLTLQAREQHIRRAKATSNICTNQGLMVTAATIHMALMGPQGLLAAAEASHANTRRLAERLVEIPGVTRRFESPVFHEMVLKLPKGQTQSLYDGLVAEGILGGYLLNKDYPELGDTILVCATEKREPGEIDYYGEVMERLISGMAR